MVEIDGYQWHTVLSNFNRDRRKDRALQRLGIQVSRVTWGQMEGEAMQLIAEIATTLALRMRAVVVVGVRGPMATLGCEWSPVEAVSVPSPRRCLTIGTAR